ncbi:28S ribosomal protein S16, mitochondrial [Galemys pyrenaicus]|uniref:Small ribosomal subunit protein bS16m n=1 Tax=Galemys pyrenaicus TaxID=202257 RepID=A0A8J5ZQJ5_GALPY|nr:28S ribosomal protein S16, mitochondrial [Galemys pyrenaicus]
MWITHFRYAGPWFSYRLNGSGVRYGVLQLCTSWRKGIVLTTSFCPYCVRDTYVLTIDVSTASLLCKAYRGGHLTIRLTLGGCTNRPFYRIVAAHNKCPRDGRFVEQLGSYDPLPNSHGEKLVALNLERIRHWIGCLSGFFPLHPMMITNAERLRRKRAREVLLASQKTNAEATETNAS